MKNNGKSPAEKARWAYELSLRIQSINEELRRMGITNYLGPDNAKRKNKMVFGNSKPKEQAVPPPPTGRQSMSPAGLAQTKYCEGLYLSSYQDSRGVWTIGYGRIEYDNGKRVGPNETCTQEQAEAWLLEDVENDGCHYVRAWVKTPLTQNQFDALSDFTFNRGAGRLKTLLGMEGKIYDNFLIAVPGDTELGLKRRRQMNRAMYLGLDWAAFKEWKPA